MLKKPAFIVIIKFLTLLSFVEKKVKIFKETLFRKCLKPELLLLMNTLTLQFLTITEKKTVEETKEDVVIKYLLEEMGGGESYPSSLHRYSPNWLSFKCLLTTATGVSTVFFLQACGIGEQFRKNWIL